MREGPAREPGSLVQRIGAPDGKSALFVVSAGGPNGGEQRAEDRRQGMVEMYVETGRDLLRHKGIDVTLPEVEDLLQRKAAQSADEYERTSRDQGVAPDIIRLLSAPVKRDAERIAARMVITAEEFSNLVCNARPQLGYRHRMKWKEFRPEQHHAYSDDISEALSNAKPGPASPQMVKAMRKMEAMMEERKRVHAHMFERGAKWHCFFFDLNDLSDPGRVGPHVHYISHRWSIDRETVWNEFDQRRQSLPRAVHIRYVDEQLERAAARRRVPRRKTTSGHILRVDPAPGDATE